MGNSVVKSRGPNLEVEALALGRVDRLVVFDNVVPGGEVPPAVLVIPLLLLRLEPIHIGLFVFAPAEIEGASCGCPPDSLNREDYGDLVFRNLLPFDLEGNFADRAIGGYLETLDVRELLLHVDALDVLYRLGRVLHSRLPYVLRLCSSVL